jgi:hypothetical protein
MTLKILPYALGALIGAAATLGIVKATQPVIKINPTPCRCDCPEVKPCEKIDFDKIKNVRGLQIHNHLVYVLGSDTVSAESLEQTFRRVAQELKLSRCK